jgi:hypothetical protein
VIAAALLLAACGGEDVVQQKNMPIPDTGIQQQISRQREAVKEQRAEVEQAVQETRCIRAYLTDMRSQQQGIRPEWSQPRMDTYMASDCEPLLGENKLGSGLEPSTGL